MAFLLVPEAAPYVLGGIAFAGGVVAGLFAKNKANEASPMAAETQQAVQGKSAAELEELVRKLTEQVAEMKEKMKDPPNEDAVFDRFLASLSDLDLTPQYPKHPDIFRIGFLGKVSVGKSSLINALYGSKVAKAGRGRTTKTPTLVGELKLAMVTKKRTLIYDIPGDDSEYSYVDVKALQLVNSLDLLVVVFDDTISYSLKVLKLAKALGKHIVFVRNKLDNSDDDELSWQEELEEDKNELARMLPTSVPFPMFGVSAKNSLKAVKAALKSGNTAAPAPCETYQWNAFMKELINLSEADRDDGTPAGGEVCHNDIRDRP